MRFNGAINDFFDGSCVRALPKLAQDERKRIIPGWQLMNLHTDGYESVVDDGAVTKIDFVAFAGLPDFMGERLQVTMARMQIGFNGLGVGKSGHDGVSLQRDWRKGLDDLKPAEPVFWAGHIDLGAMRH